MSALSPKSDTFYLLTVHFINIIQSEELTTNAHRSLWFPVKYLLARRLTEPTLWKDGTFQSICTCQHAQPSSVSGVAAESVIRFFELK